MVSFPVTLNDP